MSLHNWTAFALLFLVLSYTPGPNMLLSAAHGMVYGPRGTVVTAVGLVGGLWILIGISAAGVGAVMSASPTAFIVVRWVGAFYMAWMGWKALTAPPLDLDEKQADGAGDGARQRFLQGLAVSLSNPKAIVVFSAILPQFVEQDRPLLLQVGHEIATISVVEFSMIMTAATLAGRLVPWLKQSGRTVWINRVSGGVLIGAALLMAILSLL